MNTDMAINELAKFVSDNSDPLMPQPTLVKACDEAAFVLKMLSLLGMKNTTEAYYILQKAVQNGLKLTKYEIDSPAVKKDGVWHCPECNGQVGVNNTHCKRCGKKLRWAR